MDFIDENYRENPKIWCSKSSTWWLIHHHVLIDHRISVKFMCKCRLEFTYSTSTYRLGCFELFQVSNLHSNRNTQRVLWLCFLVWLDDFGSMGIPKSWRKEWLAMGKRVNLLWFRLVFSPGNPEYCCKKKGLKWGKDCLNTGFKVQPSFVPTKSMVFLPMWTFTMKRPSISGSCS